MAEEVETRPDHPEDESRLAREVAAFAAHDEHPEPGRLVAYQAGSLSEGEADSVADHLADCAHCASLVLDLADTFAARAGGAGVFGFPAAAVQAAAVAATLAASGAGEPAGGDDAYARPSFPRWSLRTTPRWVLGAAAALFLVSVGLSFTVVAQNQRLAAKGRPSAGLQVATLQAEGTTRGAEEEAESVRLPATLILPLPTQAADREVELSVREAGGEPRWSGRTKADRELITAQIYLPSGSLSAGSYVIDVRLAEGARGEPLSSFPLEVKD